MAAHTDNLRVIIGTVEIDGETVEVPALYEIACCEGHIDAEENCDSCDEARYLWNQAMPRYRWEFYRAEYGNSWETRAQWLVFDRKGVGCMASFGNEAHASLVVTALNAHERAQVQA